MNRRAPRQGADVNNGVYRTDKRFLKVVRSEFKIVFDLASSDDNCVVKRHFTEKDDALSRDWPRGAGYSWLNPPYRDIWPWAQRCYEQSLRGSKTLLLVPASVGADWFKQWVWGKAEIRFLNGRLTFEGHAQGYPKDLMLAVFDRTRASGASIWNWRIAMGKKPKNPFPANQKLFRVVGWYIGEGDQWVSTKSELLNESDAQAFAREWDRKVEDRYGPLPARKSAAVILDDQAVAEFETKKAERRLAK